MNMMGKHYLHCLKHKILLWESGHQHSGRAVLCGLAHSESVVQMGHAQYEDIILLQAPEQHLFTL